MNSNKTTARFIAGLISGAPTGLNELFLGVWLVIKGFNRRDNNRT
jgi:hypothetical protein